MGLLNRRRRKTDKEDLAESVVYENIKKDSKLDDLVLLYDEKSIILFESARPRQMIKKV